MTAPLALTLSVASFPVETVLLGLDDQAAVAIAQAADPPPVTAIIGPPGPGITTDLLTRYILARS